MCHAWPASHRVNSFIMNTVQERIETGTIAPPIDRSDRAQAAVNMQPSTSSLTPMRDTTPRKQRGSTLSPATHTSLDTVNTTTTTMQNNSACNATSLLLRLAAPLSQNPSVARRPQRGLVGCCGVLDRGHARRIDQRCRHAMLGCLCLCRDPLVYTIFTTIITVLRLYQLLSERSKTSTVRPIANQDLGALQYVLAVISAET